MIAKRPAWLRDGVVVLGNHYGWRKCRVRYVVNGIVGVELLGQFINPQHAEVTLAKVMEWPFGDAQSWDVTGEQIAEHVAVRLAASLCPAEVSALQAVVREGEADSDDVPASLEDAGLVERRRFRWTRPTALGIRVEHEVGGRDA